MKIVSPIKDIAIGLSNICRFGGQIREHYNVAQHSLIVTSLAPERLKKVALMHDAAEAYIGDVIKPLKVILGYNYKAIENEFERIIFSKFGIDHNCIELIKPYDRIALEMEHDHFFGDRNLLREYMIKMFEATGVIWDIEFSSKLFYTTFCKLFNASYQFDSIF